MKRLFDQSAADAFVAAHPDILPSFSLRVYTSRLLGQASTLVLHGGGNTSVKCIEKDLFDQEKEVLYVKGSGIDMADIEPDGFSVLDLVALRRLRSLQNLSDDETANQLLIHKSHMDISIGDLLIPMKDLR